MLHVTINAARKDTDVRHPERVQAETFAEQMQRHRHVRHCLQDSIFLYQRSWNSIQNQNEWHMTSFRRN